MAARKKSALETEFRACIKEIRKHIETAATAQAKAQELAREYGIRVQRDGVAGGMFGWNFDSKWDELPIDLVEDLTGLYCYDAEESGVKVSTADWSESSC